jgi:DNA-binding transcriptional MerR regulator
MTAEPVDDTSTSPSWTVDELAGLVGSTVRTIRYYTSLGILPPPERRGRMAYYDDRHRARLELVQTMQDQGLSLAAIEQHLSRLHHDSPVGEIEMRRALVSSWAPIPPTAVDRAELERRAGRALTVRDLRTLERLGTIRAIDDKYEAGPTFEVGVDLLDLDIPVASMEAAGEAISRHMDALILELRDILRTQVLAPMRAQQAETNPAEFALTMTRLRQLTLDAVVGNFQQAANGLVDGSLLGRGVDTSSPKG